MKLLYFAWVRERVGTSEESRDLPGSVQTAGELKTWLASIDEGYAYAFEDQAIIRVALDKKLVEDDASLADASEAAFFPPMTGG
ncbi:MAG: molybdopterin converting factor subunit 1 [Cohaesibacteraceae bacterium]